MISLSKPINQPELFARVRSLLRVKALQDEVMRQAEALKRWNLKLEDRVRAQVAELERLGQLKRFFSPSVVEAILTAGENRSSRRIGAKSVTCLSISAASPRSPIPPEPEEVEKVLSDFHAAMGALIAEHEGTIDRFAGDGILVFFNDPLPTSEPGKRAARMALAMRARFAELRARWLQIGYELDLGMGIAQGYATLGAFGFEGRWDYSAIGGVVNLAARLCGEAKPGQILVDRRTRAMLGDEFGVDAVGPMSLKGFSHPVPAFALTDATPEPDRHKTA